MTASRRRFSQEFKDELCQEVISTSKPIREVAESYDDGTQRSATGGPTKSTTDTSSQPWQLKKNHQSAVRNQNSSPYLAREIFSILKTLPDQHKNPTQPELTT